MSHPFGIPVKKLPGGWSMDRIAYSEAAKGNALDYIKRIRRTVELPKTDAMAGVRFDSDDAVYVRLESMYDEVIFSRFPMACVEAALIDAAQSDYFYEYEKEYEDRDYADDELSEAIE